jgi:hypothetical protein
VSQISSSITLHKAGRYIILKPNDPLAADVLNEVRERQLVECMRNTNYYGISLPSKFFHETGRIEIYRWLDNIDQHPMIDIFKSYGLQINISPSLKNYTLKESRRQKLEQTPYPLPPIVSDVSLFDRCCEGLILKCTKDFNSGGSGVIFRAGQRYMVTAVGGDGRDVVYVSTQEMHSRAVINSTNSNDAFEWTPFHEPMEGWFDDSESTASDPDLLQVYPQRVQAMADKLKKLNLPLYEHVAVDASMMALKRGVLNAYPMRMAKTSAGIAVAELSESKKVAIISPGNARIFWCKEFKRLGFTEDVDYKVIDSWSDVDHRAKYHLYTFNWLRYKKDTTQKDRTKYKNLLKPSVHVVKIQDPSRPWNVKARIDSNAYLYNLCPHCQEKMQRRIWREEIGMHEWVVARGYICRNANCTWTSTSFDPSIATKDGLLQTTIQHKGGYIDFDLAAHANCEDERLKGRQCPTCKATDGAWRPPRYKRLTKKYTHVIVDEAHAGKDPNSDTAAASFNFRARRRQELTGTPISNSPMDIYWLLHWTMNAPSPQFPYFRSEGAGDFDRKFCDQIYLERPIGTEKDAAGNDIELTKIVRKRIPFLKNPPDFWKFMAPKVRRRTYQDALYQKTLVDAGKKHPETDIKKVIVDMDGIQARLLLESLKDFKTAFERMKAEAEEKNQMLNIARIQNMSQMVTMRTLATCPEALNAKFHSQIYEGPIGGGKMSRIKKIVDEKANAGEKVVILSDFRAMQKAVSDELNSYGVIKFDTSWDEDKRAEAFECFQSEAKYKVFVGGTRAIRESVDLSSANTCICCDLLWSPGFQTQAWSRVMAPTSMDRTCEVWLLLSKNSIDEHIYNTFYSKMMAAAQAMDRRVLERRAKEVDVRWFVDRILEAEQSLAVYVRDQGYENLILPRINLDMLETREG